MSAFLLILLIFIWNWITTNSQCRYASLGGTFPPFPIDLCMEDAGGTSIMFVCNRYGTPVWKLYNTIDCTGDATSFALNSSSLFGGGDYNCYGSSSDCELVDYRYSTCDSASNTYEFTFVANVCSDSNNGYELSCGSGSYQSRLSYCGNNYDSTTYSPTSYCSESITDCYGGSVSSGSSAGESGSSSSSSLSQTGVIIIAIVGLVFGLLLIVLIAYCMTRSSRRRKKNILQPTSQAVTVNSVQIKAVPQTIPKPPMVMVATVSGGDEPLPTYDVATIADVPSAVPLVASAPVIDDGITVVNNAPLPPGWRELKAPDGRIYYQNDNTKKTQWTRPQPEKVLPYGWRKGYTQDGREYYLNDFTKQTQWNFPTQPAMDQPPQYHADVNSDIGYGMNVPPAAFAPEEPGLDRMESAQQEGGGHTVF